MLTLIVHGQLVRADKLSLLRVGIVARHGSLRSILTFLGVGIVLKRFARADKLPRCVSSRLKAGDHLRSPASSASVAHPFIGLWRVTDAYSGGFRFSIFVYVRQFQRVLPVAIEASKPSAAGLHQRPPHGSVALETARRRKVSNNHDAHPELGGSTKLSVTDKRPRAGGDGSSLAPLLCRVHDKSN